LDLAPNSNPSAAALDDLLRRPQRSNEYIGFFFCENDFTNSLDARTILGCLSRQCLSVETLTRSEELRLKQFLKTTYPDNEDLKEVLKNAVLQSSSTTFIIDGLNECPQAERATVLGTLSRVMSSSRAPIKLFLSGREGLIAELSRVFDTWHQVMINCTEAHADIPKYIDGVVNDKFDSKELAIGDKKLVQEVKDALIHGANGM
jgi:hypothetical protein